MRTGMARAEDRGARDGDTSLARGHLVSATVLSASRRVLRQAFFFARLDIIIRKDLQDDYDAHEAAFRAAVSLVDHSCERMDIEADGVVVTGYLLRPTRANAPRVTVLAPSGYDPTAESRYVDTACSALELGLNCLIFEGPGQGGVLCSRSQALRRDFETALRPVVDWLIERPGVAPQALVLFRRSFAGYLAPRRASGEPRIAALVCDPAYYDSGVAVRARLGETTWQRLIDPDRSLDADLTVTLADPQQANDSRCRMATHGVTTLSDHFRSLGEFSLAGLTEEITCPTLLTSAEGDFADLGQLENLAGAARCTITPRRFTVVEGAGGHCEGLGQARLDRVVYDWIIANLPARRDPLWRGDHAAHQPGTAR